MNVSIIITVFKSLHDHLDILKSLQVYFYDCSLHHKDVFKDWNQSLQLHSRLGANKYNVRNPLLINITYGSSFFLKSLHFYLKPPSQVCFYVLKLLSQKSIFFYNLHSRLVAQKYNVHSPLLIHLRYGSSFRVRLRTIWTTHVHIDVSN